MIGAGKAWLVVSVVVSGGGGAVLHDCSHCCDFLRVWIAPTMIVWHVVAATPVFVVEPLVPRDLQTFLQTRMAQII